MQLAKDYITQVSKSASPNAPKFRNLGKLFEKKLWHQLTVDLESFVKEPQHTARELLDLYNNFIKEFEGKLNQLQFVNIILIITDRIASADALAANDFLTSITSKISENEKEAKCLAQSELAFLKLTRLNNSEESKQIADSVQTVLDTMTGADPSVYSSYYKFLSVYYKMKIAPTDFYKNTLMYLVYTPLENIPLQDQQAIAFDLGMTALVSRDIHNFGELMAHPILKSLENTPKEWLVHFLIAFNSGNIGQYETMLTKYKQQIDEQAILKQSFALLREKISILALMDLVFTRPSEERTIPFSIIADATRLNIQEVELLVMKSMSLKLIQGTIDEVSQTVTVSWVQPRVLNLQQIAKMKERLESWTNRVEQVLNFMQNETAPELFA